MTIHNHTLDNLPVVELPPEFILHPGHLLARARHEVGPIFNTINWLGECRLYLVGPEANRLVMITDHEKFSNYDGWNRTDTIVDTLGKSLIFMDGADHKRLRATVAPAFSVASVTRYIPEMNAIISDRLDTWRAGSVIDLYKEIHGITFEIAAAILVGLKRGSEITRLSALFHELISLEPSQTTEASLNPVSLASRRYEIKNELRRVLGPAITRRREVNGIDPMARLASVRDGDGRLLSDEALISQANGFLLAGHVTTSSLCAFLLHHLAGDGHNYDRIMAEQRALGINPPNICNNEIAAMEILGYAIKEAIRMYPPVPALPRGVTEDILFEGYLIPKGQTIFCSIIGTHMSDDLFPNPGAFDPDRFAPGREEHRTNPLALVGFSAGPRSCLGVTMATAEIKLILSHVLGRFVLNPLAESSGTTLYDPILRPMESLKVGLKPI